MHPPATLGAFLVAVGLASVVSGSFLRFADRLIALNAVSSLLQIRIPEQSVCDKQNRQPACQDCTEQPHDKNPRGGFPVPRILFVTMTCCI